MKRHQAEKIAENFIKEMNPNMWNGVGEKPSSFDTRIATYNINSRNNNELGISFELEENPDTLEMEWTHYCELRDKSSRELVECLHGYGIDSIHNLTDTIISYGDGNANRLWHF